MITLQKVCPSKFPDAFGRGVGVVAGAEISGFSFYDQASGAWVQKDVKQTINTSGVFDRGCINFSQFSLGQYRYRDKPLSIKLTLKRLESTADKAFADSIFDEANKALTAATGGSYAAFVPVSQIVYKAVMEHNVGEAALLEFTIGFQPASTASDAPFIPRRGRMTIIGEVQSDGWDLFKESKRPTQEEVAQLVVADNGELLRNGQQYSDAFYATFSIDRIYRNPDITASLEQLQNQLLLNAFLVGENNVDAKARAEDLMKFISDATNRQDFLREEQAYASDLNDCLLAWVRWWTAGGKSGTQNALGRIEAVRAGCRNFNNSTDKYAGESVTADLARARCSADAPAVLGFSPLCSEYRARVRMASYVDSVVQELNAAAEKEAAIVEAVAKSASLQEALTKKKVEVAGVYEQLQKAGLDVENIAKSIQEHKEALERARLVAARFEALKKSIAALSLGGPDVAIRHNRIVVNLPSEVLFESGKSELTDSGKDVLRKVSGALRSSKDLSNRSFEVVGHTDNVPFKTGSISDNWQLSFLRARSVHALLTDPLDGGLSPSALSIGAAADTEPIAPNDTEDGKQKNRRVEIVLVPAVDEIVGLKQQVDN